MSFGGGRRTLGLFAAASEAACCGPARCIIASVRSKPKTGDRWWEWMHREQCHASRFLFFGAKTKEPSCSRSWVKMVGWRAVGGFERDCESSRQGKEWAGGDGGMVEGLSLQ